MTVDDTNMGVVKMRLTRMYPSTGLSEDDNNELTIAFETAWHVVVLLMDLSLDEKS